MKWLYECHDYSDSGREGTLEQLGLLSVIDTYSVEVPGVTVCQYKGLDAPRVRLAFQILSKRDPPLVGDD